MAITTSDLLVQNGIVPDKARASFLGQKTPKGAIYLREGRGGKKFRYIKGDYVIKTLNMVFAFNWDFRIIPIKNDEMFYMSGRQIIVMGELVIKDSNGVSRIVKTATGKKDVVYQKDPKTGTFSNTPIDLGNDIKAAETDALKRAASRLGIGIDLYDEDKVTKNEEYND